MYYQGRSTTSLIISIMVVLDHLPAVMAAAQCFGVDGQKSASAPCNSNATGTANSHSSCCDESKQEACLSSGLCYATQRGDNKTFWAEGCTDPLGRDPTCPSYCGATSQFISMPVQPSYTMLFCGDSRWCCCFDNFGKACDKTECCSRNFTLSQGLGTIVHQFDNTVSSGSIGSNKDNDNDTNCRSRSGDGDCNGWDGRERDMRMIPMIIAGVLGSLFLATIVAFGFSCTQNRRLRRQVETLQNINANLKSYSTISARPSVHSIQPLVPFNYPSYSQDETTPSPDTYDTYHQPPNTGNTMRTTLNSAYHLHSNHYHHEPPTPSSIGPPPGYGFPPPHPPMPPQLSGRRPSLPRNAPDGSVEIQYAQMQPPPPQQLAGMGVISELPTEKDQR